MECPFCFSENMTFETHTKEQKDFYLCQCFSCGEIWGTIERPTPELIDKIKEEHK